MSVGQLFYDSRRYVFLQEPALSAGTCPICGNLLRPIIETHCHSNTYRFHLVIGTPVREGYLRQPLKDNELPLNNLQKQPVVDQNKKPPGTHRPERPYSQCTSHNYISATESPIAFTILKKVATLGTVIPFSILEI